MYARLYAKAGKLAGKSYDIVTEAVIGHGPECNLLVKSGVLSAKHARIYFDQKRNSYFLEDFKSYNGTMLDGKPVQGKVKLEKKHVITFANTFTFIFQVESGQAADPLPPPPVDLPPQVEAPPAAKRKHAAAGEPAGEAPPAAPERQQPKHDVEEHPPSPPKPAPGRHPAAVRNEEEKPHTVFDDEYLNSLPPLEPYPEAAEASPPTPTPAPPLPRDAAPTMLIDESQMAELLHLPRFAVEFKTVRGEKYTIDLKEGENTVGRLSGSDVTVDDASISRNHAVITVRTGKVTLKDLGSKNGTFVADKKLADEIEIAPDTPIRFGLIKATILKKSTAPA